MREFSKKRSEEVGGRQGGVGVGGGVSMKVWFDPVATRGSSEVVVKGKPEMLLLPHKRALCSQGFVQFKSIASNCFCVVCFKKALATL